MSAANEEKKKKVRGFVDRVTAGIVVVVIPHPDDPTCQKEIYIPEEKFTTKKPKEGDRVTVTIREKNKHR